MARINPAKTTTSDLVLLVTLFPLRLAKAQLRICRHIRLHLQIIQHVEIRVQVVILIQLL